ncbi:MAG: xanthine dehydrogenase family protein molybdopterin-binding subunit [Alphaproteobacteria bacterium]|nr:xanthine dehydrogenase family protein molybdopterin-binding subunit [Alphaproteobacteria bacterium]
MSAQGKTDQASAPSRREFLKVSLAAGGAMLLAFPAGRALAQGNPAKYVLRPNAFVRIDPTGHVTLIIPQEEMGQGVYTALSQLLADELDVSLDRVTPEAAPPSDAIYGSPMGGGQGTGGSTSIRAFYTALRQVGASARAMLVQAAAAQWHVDPASLRTENGEVIDDAGKRRLGYGALAAAAAKLPAPQDPPLKADKDFKLIGKSVKRLDTPDKVNGKAQYGIDVRMPGLKVAVLMAAPVVGGKVAGVDQAAALKVPGARQVVVLDDIVAVVGDHFWAAKQGLAAASPRWNDGPNATRNSQQILQELEIASRRGVIAKKEGDADKGLSSDPRIDAAYQVPFLAHAPMEPLNFTVHVKNGGCEMWGGSQVQASAQAAAAKVLGVPQEKVVFHNYMLGGGFGRRLDVDMVEKAVRVAQKVEGPVKVMWTREEDMRQDMYRPAYRNVMSASVNSEGRITGWMHRVTGGSVIERMFGPLKNGIDNDALDGATEMPYDVADQRIEYSQAEPRALRMGWWRGVGPNNTVFAIESMIDELAKKAGQDPIAFRLAHLTKNPRLKAVVERAARESDWGKPLPARHGRGICAQRAFGTYMATVAEVSVESDGTVRVRRMTSVVDAGRVVNPDTLASQVQGGLIFGLTAALHGDITIANGRVQQGNFNDYRMMRINEAPRIDVHIIPSREAPGGIGEPGCTAGPPSLINAVAAATGVRLRQLPVDRRILAGRRTV